MSLVLLEPFWNKICHKIRKKKEVLLTFTEKQQTSKRTGPTVQVLIESCLLHAS